jgi:hypothetical protein
LGFIISTIPCPSKTMLPTEKEESYVPNIAYDIWFEQDQAILNAIL